jgi:hypothetical protein
VPEGDHWYYEVQFRLNDSTYIPPKGQIWTAVIRESKPHRTADGMIIGGQIYTCELGADRPTLRDGQFPPPPADQVKAHEDRAIIDRILNPLRQLDIPPKIPKGEVTILEDTLGLVYDFGVSDRNIDEFTALVTAQYLDDRKTLDTLFDNGKGHFVLIKKGTRVLLENGWPNQGAGTLQVTFHGKRREGESGHDGWSDYAMRLPVSALLKDFSHPATYVPKSNAWVISNESQAFWLKNPGPPGPAPIPTPQELPESSLAAVATPTPDWKGNLVGQVSTYDMVWDRAPNEVKIKLHDEEIQFRESLKALDDQTKCKKLEERESYLRDKTMEANAAKNTPSPNTAAHTIRANTPEEAAEQSTLRQQYSKAFMALPASTRRQLHDPEIDFEIKMQNEDGTAQNSDLRERIKYFENLRNLDSEDSSNRNSVSNNAPAVPTPQPPVSTPQPAAPAGINSLVQQYDKMWQAAYAAQPESSRAKLQNEEIAFRASLKGLDPNASLQQLVKRMMYFQSLTMKLPSIPPLPPTQPPPESGSKAAAPFDPKQ